jgi:hypothetical protein
MQATTLEEIELLIAEEKRSYDRALRDRNSDEVRGRSSIVARIIACSHAYPDHGPTILIFTGQFVAVVLTSTGVLGVVGALIYQALFFTVVYFAKRGTVLRRVTDWYQARYLERLEKLDRLKDALVEQRLGSAA